MPPSKEKQRLCWNCEGAIALDADFCPYCGVGVAPPTLSENPAPSFTSKGDDFDIPLPPYQSQPPAGEDREELPGDMLEPDPSPRLILLSLITFMGGSFFIIFGLLLLLFAHDSPLVLSWEGDKWWLYILLGIPLMIWGWRYSQKISQGG